MQARQPNNQYSLFKSILCFTADTPRLIYNFFIRTLLVVQINKMPEIGIVFF